MALAYMKDTAMESVMDVSINVPERITHLLNKYHDRFLPQCCSQILQSEFAYIV